MNGASVAAGAVASGSTYPMPANAEKKIPRQLQSAVVERFRIPDKNNDERQVASSSCASCSGNDGPSDTIEIGIIDSYSSCRDIDAIRGDGVGGLDFRWSVDADVVMGLTGNRGSLWYHIGCGHVAGLC